MDQRKKNIIYGIVFMLLSCLLIVGGILFGKYGKINNHNQQKNGIYKIKLEGWESSSDEQYRNWARESLSELNRLGPTFEIVDRDADIRVIRAEIVSNSEECRTKAAIVFLPHTLKSEQRILIDPVCTRGELAFKTAFMHEIGHSLGMTHVCRLDEDRDDCSSVGRGPAVMNPNLLYETQDQNLESMPTWELQELDFKEYCRVRICFQQP